MSKNSGNKSKLKRKKAIERENRKTALLNQKAAKTRDIISALPSSYFIERLKPDKKSVIFKGLSDTIAQQALDKLPKKCALPLQDFYAEVALSNDETVKMRYIPYDGPVSKEDLYNYARDTNRYTVANADMVPPDPPYGNFTPDMITASLIIEYRGYFSLGYVVFNPQTCETATFGLMHESICKLSRNDHYAYQMFMKQCSNVSGYAFAIQKIVEAYLNGDELPQFTDYTRRSPKSASGRTSTTHTRPSAPKEPRKKDSEACIAYIHLDCESRKLCITNSSKHYSMRWWIVSGHQRRNPNGTISKVRPYIKGDKSDPAAEAALAEFVAGEQRIRYYHLIARTAK